MCGRFEIPQDSMGGKLVELVRQDVRLQILHYDLHRMLQSQLRR